MKDPTFRLEMHGLERGERGTTDWLNEVVKRLSGAYEEIAYLRKALAKSKNLDNAEVAQRLSAEKSGPRFIQCLGFAKDVPKYMRWKGKVKLRPIGSKELQILIQQVWKERETGGWDEVLMEEVFAAFLQMRFNSDHLVAEWGYNVVHALEQHKYDADCELFLAVLTGQVSDKVKYGSDKMMKKLKDGMHKVNMLTLALTLALILIGMLKGRRRGREDYGAGRHGHPHQGS